MKLFLAVLVCLLTGYVGAQRYSFIKYTVKDGLSQSQVKDICQDQHGYLWIGTNSGLSRFNGIEFENYSIDDGLSDNIIRKLYVGKEGALWIATAGGVSKLVGNAIETLDFDEQYRINDIAEFKGEIYFASNTGLIGLKEKEFYQVGDEAAHEYYFRAIVNYKDSVLICGSKEGIFTWNGEVFNKLDIQGYEDFNVRGLKLIDKNLYISAVKVGLLKYSLKKNKSDILGSNAAWDFDVYEDKIFGIIPSYGAFLKDSNQTLYFKQSNWLMQSFLKCVFRDSEGNIWIGTDGEGVMKFSGTSVVHYLKEDQLSGNVILSIMEDSLGNFIYGSYNEGVSRFQNDSAVIISRSGGILGDNNVWTILCDSLNHIWLGTSRGLTILDENNQLVQHPDIEMRRKIRTIIEFDRQTILMGGDEGLSVMKPDTVYHLHPDLNIQKLHIVNNRVFCATFDGLYEFEPNSGFKAYTMHGLPELKVNTLTSDFNGNLWIGTENGLFIMLANQSIIRFQLDEQNYRSKQVLGLIAGRDSSIWVSGMNGVYQVNYAPDIPSGYQIFNYGDSEGMIDEEANINALYEDTKGNIWIGTASGLVRIDPESSKDLFSFNAPILHISNLRLFMEDFNFPDYQTEMDTIFNVPKSIELPHSKNHLTFDFIGINLKDPESVNYRYRLIGVSDEWSPVSKSNYATYSFLQPGEYIFQVKASNKLGKWSGVKEVKIKILPPFWKTWWFVTLILIAVFFMIVYIFEARIKALKQRQENEKLDLKNRLLFLEQRSLNASMNRHFIFNSLNSIQYFINGSDKLSANRFLSNFAKLIRKNLDSSAANNFIVTLQEEIERIELYLSLEKMRFSDKFDYVVSVSSTIDTETIEIPSMILQPFVENSIIHGVLSLDRKGEITVKVYQEFGEVVFEVIDNGQGIENSLRSKQNQMAGDHESRGVEITNRRIEILRKLTGENLLIIGPFQMDDEEGRALGTKVMIKLGGAEKFEN